MSPGIANDAFKDIIIQLQSRLLTHLVAAQDNDDSIHDFHHLVDVSDFGRTRSVLVLNELHMRMAQAAPIDRWQGGGTSQNREIAAPGLQHMLPSSQAFVTSPPSSDRSWNTQAQRSATGMTASTSPTRDPQRSMTSMASLTSSPRDPLLNQAPTGINEILYAEPRSPTRVKTVMDEPHRSPTNPKKGLRQLFSPILRSNTFRPDDTKKPQISFPQPASIADQSPDSQSLTGSSSPGSVGPSPDLQNLTSPQIPVGENPWHSESSPSMRESRPKGLTKDRPTKPSRIWSFSSSPAMKGDFGGFCEGACTMRTGNQGMILRNQSTSMTGQSHYWACSNSKCSFEGGAIKSGKDWTLDESIRSAHGVRYRWKFLAKSHIVPTGRVKNREYDYQCVFCSAQGSPPTVARGERAFIRHVGQHRGDKRNPFGMQLIFAVFGRVTLDEEQFDVNLTPPREGSPEGSQLGSPVSPREIGGDRSPGLGITMEKREGDNEKLDNDDVMMFDDEEVPLGFDDRSVYNGEYCGWPAEAEDNPLVEKGSPTWDRWPDQRGDEKTAEKTSPTAQDMLAIHPALRGSFSIPDPWRASYVTMRRDSSAEGALGGS